MGDYAVVQGLFGCFGGFATLGCKIEGHVLLGVVLVPGGVRWDGGGGCGIKGGGVVVMLLRTRLVFFAFSLRAIALYSLCSGQLVFRVHFQFCV